ncbi:MAG: hypothetical protein ABR571_03385 [Jatrophihabitans sp.]
MPCLDFRFTQDEEADTAPEVDAGSSHVGEHRARRRCGRCGGHDFE